MSDSVTLIVILLISFFAYSLLSRRFEGSVITAPIIFVSVGILVSSLGLGLVDFESQREAILIFAEVALVITLLSNAAGVNIRVLRSNRIPGRLLLIGLPLTIGLGAVIAALLFKNLALAEAALIGSVLAPTDASLGQSIVKNKKIPIRMRQAIDVESGLNDGGSVPFFALFLIIAQAELEHVPLDSWVIFAAEQIGLGIILGAIAGLIGGWLLNKATVKVWIDSKFQSIALIALALSTWLVADHLGGSGFIAAYMAGLMIAFMRSRIPEQSIELAGTEGEVLGLGVFFILGVAMASIFPSLGVVIVLYAILSLTIVRMIPVAVSLIGTRLDRRSTLFIGWFGPRGLASIVLILIAMGSMPEIPNIDIITAVVFLTVLFSIFAHGLSAVPAINRLYGKRKADSPEGSDGLSQ